MNKDKLLQLIQQNTIIDLSGLTPKLILKPNDDIIQSIMNELGIPYLSGEAARQFEEYNERILSAEEKASLEKAHEFYKKASKSGE